MIPRWRFASTRIQESVKHQDHVHPRLNWNKSDQHQLRNSKRNEYEHLEPLAVENGDEHSNSTAEFLVHDLASAVKYDHKCSSIYCSVRTQTFVNSEHLDEQNQEIKRSKVKLEGKKFQRELFTTQGPQVTTEDSAVRFYTGMPFSLALIMAIFNVLKPGVKKMNC